MSLIATISADKKVNQEIKTCLESEPENGFLLRFSSNSKDVMEILNYDLPEIVLINTTDPDVELDKIVEQIHTDSWLHNFGIIALYSRKISKERTILEQLKNINVLAVLDYSKIKTHLIKTIKIIEKNKQIIFQKELGDTFSEIISGSISIENDPLSVPAYAGIAATTLSQRGLINTEKRMNLQLSLIELMINGIEHGNCKISYEEKSQALMQGKSIVELVAEKCRIPEIANKRVHFEWELKPDISKFTIRDEGDGFDVMGLKEKLKKSGITALHGRGIKMARSFSNRLRYNKKGNEVTLFIEHKQTNKGIPEGFTDEDAIFPEKGDIIFNEGEESNFLYYISSGTYSVYHKNVLVGMLTPEDIFMGEMSFLMSNRRSATVKTETTGKLIKVSRKSFIMVIKKYPHYGIFLSKLLAMKLTKANEKRADILEHLKNTGI